MFDLKTLLLPVDFSERSLEAARQAKAIGRHFHFRLIVLNVVEGDQSTWLDFEAAGSSAEELPAYLNREFRETPVQYLVERGNPARVIADRARSAGADLIVMAGHNRTPFESFALGSVTAELLCCAPCPVWTSVPGQKGPAPLFRRLLCAVALSEMSGNTLEWALGFADAVNATCDVMCASQSTADQDEHRITEELLPGAERDELEKIKRSLGPRGQVILAGESVKGVCAAFTDLRSDLLVIGRGHEHDELARVHSLCYQLVHDAPCPVVTV